jgi:hypothetical protein
MAEAGNCHGAAKTRSRRSRETVTKSASLGREFIVLGLASDAPEFSLTFPFAPAWSDWPHEVRAELHRGSYDPDWDSPYYTLSLTIDSGFAEQETYPDRVEEEFAEINGWLAHAVPIRFETLFRLWRARPVWVVITLPDRDESEVRKLRLNPAPFDFPLAEVPAFTAFSGKIIPALDEVAALEWSLLRADARAVMTKRGEYDHRAGLEGKAKVRLERHLAHSLALRWYELCFRREAALRIEQTVVAAMIVLETLFGEDKDGPKWKIRERAAKLLGREYNQVTFLRAALDEYYRRRNAIVHAGTTRGLAPAGSKSPILDVIRRAILIHLAASAGAELNREEVIRILDEGRASELRLAAERFLGNESWTARVLEGSG